MSWFETENKVSVTAQGPGTKDVLWGVVYCLALDLFWVDSCMTHWLWKELASWFWSQDVWPMCFQAKMRRQSVCCFELASTSEETCLAPWVGLVRDVTLKNFLVALGISYWILCRLWPLFSSLGVCLPWRVVEGGGGFEGWKGGQDKSEIGKKG